MVNIPALNTAVFVIEKAKPSPASTEPASTPATITSNSGLSLTNVGMIVAILAGNLFGHKTESPNTEKKRLSQMVASFDPRGITCNIKWTSD